MLNIPDSVKSLCKQDGVRKNFRVHFPNGELSDLTNDNVVQESVRFTESICSQDVFKFGLTEASVIEFETVGVANMYGMTIECACEIDCTSLTAAEVEAIEAGTWDGEYIAASSSDLGYVFFRVPYGTFRVESCPRDHQAMTHRRVKAYTVLLFAENADAFRGQTCKPRIKICPEDFISSLFLKNSEMQAEGATYANLDTLFLGYNNSDSKNMSFNGVAATAGYVNFSCAESDPRKKIYLRFDFEPHEFDKYASDMYAAAVAVMPNVNMIYYYDGGYYKIFADKNQAFAISSGMFSPCYFLAAVYYNPSTYSHRTRISKPVFVVPGETYVINPYDLSDYTFVQSLGSGWNKLTDVRVYTNIPFAWEASAFWRVRNYDSGGSWIGNQDTPVPNWPISGLFPAGVTRIYRNRQGALSKIYYKEVFDTYESPEIEIENTLEFSKQTIGRYYTYSNAISVRDIVQGELELTGRFLTAARNGEHKLLRISSASPVAIAPGDYAQMWFDEYEVEPIGTVRYAYTDDAGEEQIVDYKFGDGASVYDMTDNAVLKALDGAGPDVIEALLDASFIPYISSVNFVPVDLAMKGLPYMEAGDAISVTAQDGTVCSSYALRQEIDGIQSLEAQIDSQSGLIIDSEEAAT